MTWRYVGLYDFLSIFAVTVIAAFLLMLSVLLPVGFLKRGDSSRFLRPYVPEGAYYILADISGLPGKMEKRKEKLEREEKYNLVYDLFRMSWVPIARKMAMPSSNSKIKRYCIVTEPSQRFLVP